jgi:hypothetical protein
MSSKKLIPILLLLLIAGYKCTSALYKPTIDDARQSGYPLDSLLAGRKTYIISCGSCHSLYLPEQYSKKKWKISLDSMKDRSNITVEQKELILKYLESKSKD